MSAQWGERANMNDGATIVIVLAATLETFASIATRLNQRKSSRQLSLGEM